MALAKRYGGPGPPLIALPARYHKNGALLLCNSMFGDHPRIKEYIDMLWRNFKFAGLPGRCKKIPPGGDFSLPTVVCLTLEVERLEYEQFTHLVGFAVKIQSPRSLIIYEGTVALPWGETFPGVSAAIIAAVAAGCRDFQQEFAEALATGGKDAEWEEIGKLQIIDCQWREESGLIRQF